LAISTSAAKNWVVFTSLALVTVVIAAAWLASVPLVDDNIVLVVRYSAKPAFALLIIIIAARPLRQLLQRPWTAKLLQNRRLLGVAFAGVMTGHLALIAFRFGYTPELTYPLPRLIVGAGAYGMIYLLFITSFNGPTRALGPKRWKTLHRAGLIWAGLIFGVPRPLAEAATPEYLLLGIPLLAALAIRFLAWRRSKTRGNRHSAA
jgi:DMSO/TMAO reductase YedYZ heme-binding membrane subunit